MARLNRNSTFKYVAFVSSVDSTPSANSSDATLYSLSLACNCCKTDAIYIILPEKKMFEWEFKFLQPFGRAVYSANKHCAVKFVAPFAGLVVPFYSDFDPDTIWLLGLLHRI